MRLERDTLNVNVIMVTISFLHFDTKLKTIHFD